MTFDSLEIINTTLVSEILAMDRDKLWQLAETRLSCPKPEKPYKTFVFNLLEKQGVQRVHDLFFSFYEDDPDKVTYWVIEDLCFEGERVPLDYYARCGYLDSGASCYAKTSDVLIPLDNEPWDDDEWRFDLMRFDVLTGRDVERIVQSMEKNIDSLTINTADDIPKVRSIMHRCYLDEGYNAAYIYGL